MALEFVQVIPRLPTRDLRATIAFYTTILGFVTNVQWPEDAPTFVILTRDGTSVGFFEPNEHQPGPPGYAELYIEVTDARSLHAVVAARAAIEWGPEVYAYGRREFALRDPSGYLVILTKRTTDPATTNEP